MQDKSLDDVLLDFTHRKTDENFFDRHAPVTVWISKDHKDKYDMLQNSSGREFGKKLKEIILLAIEKAGQKA